MRFNGLKPQNWLLGVFSIFVLSGLSNKVLAQITLPSPGESVLVIYYATANPQVCGTGGGGSVTINTYPQDLMTAVTTVLGNIPAPNTPNITLLPIYNGDYGIYGQLSSVLGLTNLNSFCQVWDLRFLNNCDNQGWASGLNQSDQITNTGANNDTELYENYVQAGGNLFLQSDHHDYYIRNNNLIQLINNMAAAPIISAVCGTEMCPGYNSGAPVTLASPTITFTTNYNFSTIYNNLSGSTSIITDWAGGIPSGDYGSGLPLVTIPLTGPAGVSPTGAMIMGWEGGALNTTYGAGKVIASFETNAFDLPLVPGAAEFATIWAQDTIQNIYAELTGCLKYSVTKTFNPTSLSVGQTGSFTICATNNSTLNPITNYSISDTIATCLTYNSSTSTATTGTGNQSAGAAGTLYWWTFGTIAPGASACVTVNFTAANTTCP